MKSTQHTNTRKWRIMKYMSTYCASIDVIKS